MIEISDEDEKNILILLDLAEVPRYPTLVRGPAHGLVSRIKIALNELYERKRLDVQSTCPRLDVGDHDCEKSPNGRCEYDRVNDPAWDQCVHCGDPHERK
jgi:hypothetical protein